MLYQTPSRFVADTLAVNRFDGLLFVQTFGGLAGTEGRLISVWRCERAFQASEQRFEAALTGDSRRIWAKFYLGVRRREARWYGRLTVSQMWAAIVTLFLGLSYLEQVRNASGWLVGPPIVEAHFLPGTIDVLVDDEFSAEMLTRNTRPIGDCNITFHNQSVSPARGLPLEPLAKFVVPAVSPNEEAKLSLKGRALQVGEYVLTVEGEATAGLISSTRQFSCKAQVKVWESHAIATRRLKSIISDGQLCEFEFQLHIGRHFRQGLDIEAKVEKSAGVRFVGVRFPGTEQFTPLNSTTSGKEVATLEWRTAEMSPMRVITFVLVLEDAQVPSRSSADWEAILHSVQFAFSEIHSKTKHVDDPDIP